jgi:hypothetical protein
LKSENTSHPDGSEWYRWDPDTNRMIKCIKRGPTVLCKGENNYEFQEATGLPRINYEDFETGYPDEEQSRVFDLGIPDLQPDIGIGFVNGIWNNFEDCKSSVKYISRLAGGINVHGVYNATHGNCTDLKESWKNLNYIATNPVRQLHKMWNSFFDKASATAKFLMICHSQGAIHVRNALLDYPTNSRDRIFIVAIAPAGYIYRQSCAQVIHYRTASWYRDLVPHFDRNGARREKDSIFDLESHPNAAWIDHEFQSPTYRGPLLQRLINYIQSNGIYI